MSDVRPFLLAKTREASTRVAALQSVPKSSAVWSKSASILAAIASAKAFGSSIVATLIALRERTCELRTTALAIILT